MSCTHEWKYNMPKAERSKLRRLMTSEVLVCKKNKCPVVKIVHYKDDGSVKKVTVHNHGV